MDIPAATTTAPPARRAATGRARSARRGMGAMVLVGSSVGVSRTLVHAPLFAAQGLRYTIALPILVAAARLAGVRVTRPRGREWLWLAGIAATGLVLFNLAIVRGVAHAQPAAIAVAVAFVPVLLGVAGPLMQGQAPSPPSATAPPSPPAPREGDVLSCSATTTPWPSGSRRSVRP